MLTAGNGTADRSVLLPSLWNGSGGVFLVVCVVSALGLSCSFFLFFAFPLEGDDEKGIKTHLYCGDAAISRPRPILRSSRCVGGMMSARSEETTFSRN